MPTTTSSSARARSWNPLRALYDFFNSIWLGIFLILLILAYAAVGSAVPMFRQTFELNEFQYFNHWLFATLIALFCINLTVATIRRIRLNLINAGVLTVHAGLLLLCAGSVIYFGRKIEGDVWLEAPSIRIVSIDRFQGGLDNATVGRLVATKGDVWDQDIPFLGGHHHVEVMDVVHNGMKTAASVKLKVAAPNTEEKTIELSQDNSGGGGEHPNIAKLSDKLVLMLVSANAANYFFDSQTPALYLQYGSKTEDTRRFELPNLPYYNERFTPCSLKNNSDESADTTIRDTRGEVVASERTNSFKPFEKWDMPVPLFGPGDALAGDWPFAIEIDGYLPYARLDAIPMSGGKEVRPLARVKFRQGEHEDESWVVAQFPEQSLFEMENLAAAEFRWLDDQKEIPAALSRPIEGTHFLEVYVKDKNIRKTFDVSEGQKLPIEGTDYVLTVEELRPSWPLMSPGFERARTPIALVWVETPARQFQRSVLDRYPELNQDRDRAGKKILPSGGLVDDNLELTYFDASRNRFLVVSGESIQPTLIYTAPGGQRTIKPYTKGETFKTADGGEFTLVDLIVKPRVENMPSVIPPNNRRSLGDVTRTQSLIRVHLASKDGHWARHVWVPFSNYNTLHDITTPTRVNDIPGFGPIQLIYGRADRPLPATLVLEKLQTDFYPGEVQAREWTSYFRYKDEASGAIQQGKAYLNNTYGLGGWRLFQSQAPADGKSWTVLGVGNRSGVLTMLAGCIMIALGMTYAFSVKPTLVRRRKARIAASAKQKAEEMMSQNDEVSNDRARRAGHLVAPAIAIIAGLLAVTGIVRAAPPTPTVAAEKKSQDTVADLRAIQDKIDVKTFGAMAVLDQPGWRYSTVDSWSRRVVHAIHGPKKFEGLDPVVAAMELMFNGAAYQDDNIIYVKDIGILKDITSYPVELSDAEKRDIYKSGYVSYHFLTSPLVAQRIQELSGDTIKAKAMGRLGEALSNYERIGVLFTIVPNPKGDRETPWSPVHVLADEKTRAATGVSPEQAQELILAFRSFGRAWLKRDVDGINTGIAQLDKLLPKLAPAGIYPSLQERTAELKYRRLDLMWWAWLVYIFAFFTAIFALATPYRWVRGLGLFFLIGAMGLHAYDLCLRWQVLHRIPVANMYEAIVSSTLVGAALGLVLELFTKKRVYLLSSALLGFFALTLPILLPDKINNNLQTMMPILDDVMLRIHTVLIISSYAVITLAFGVANCYLFVSAFRERNRVARMTIGAQLGALACLGLVNRGYFDQSGAGFFIGAFVAAMGAGALLTTAIASMIGGKCATAATAGFRVEDFPVKRNVLEEFDRSHRVLLYIATVALFVGVVLGAVWADYSWGRPWGWDPKEVFALNTWLIYAVLIHINFVTKRKALWTSVLSVIGFAAMQFNWWVVNFYIVGLHSYA